MNKNYFIGLSLLILFVFFVNAEVYEPGKEYLGGNSDELAQPSPERSFPDYMTGEDIYMFVGNLVTLIVIFIVLTIIIVAFVKYSIKNKNNKKKSVLSLASSILLFLDSIFFFVVWIPCLNGCDMWGESIATVFLILPVAGLIIVPWIIYWVINYFKRKKE